jgi:hypothetical protein
MKSRTLMLMLACAFVLPLTFPGEYAAATDANGNKFRHLPIQWCVVAGSPTAVSPGTVDPDNPGADTNTVLWRRHERVSDRIYLRQPASNAANDVVPVTFRSAADTQTFLLNRSFPIIDGPWNPSKNGDVSSSDLPAIEQECNKQWGPNAPGIPVISVNHLDGQANVGVGGYGFATSSGDSTLHSTWGITTTYNYVVITDRKYAISGDADANLLAHELGHALNMLHTDVNMNVMKHSFDSADPPHTFSTAIEDGVDETPTTVSNGGGPFTPMPRCAGTSNVNCINQIDWHQQEAMKWPGNALDPPDSLITALLPSFLLLDTLGDVPAVENFVDLSAVRVTGDVPAGVMHVTFRLVGQIPHSFTPIDYFFLADLDNNAATGGTPGQFPSDADLPPNSFTGVELIVRVRAQQCCGEISTFTVTPTVWLFQGGVFQEQASGFAAASIEDTGSDNPAPHFAFLDVLFPLSLPTGNVRVQAITNDTANNTSDKLDDTDAGAVGSLAPPQFPVCGVSPSPVQPGVDINVTASGLVPNASAKIMVADFLLRVTTADANGNVNATVAVPSDSRTGLRLITVGTLGTALTADCAVDVEGTPAVPVAVPVDIKPTSCPNPLNVNVKGTFPVAITGTSTLDVTQIDPASIRLAGIAPLRFTYQDVATPFSPFVGKTGANACTTAGPDGFTDLSLSFDATKIASALGAVTNGQVVSMNLTGNFLPQFGGGPIVGEDVVVIKTK